MNRSRPFLLPLVAALCWAVGSAAALAGSPPSVQRVVLTLGEALPFSPAAIAAFEARVSRTAGTAVHHVAGVSALIHVVELHCATPVSCDQALVRLRSDAPYITDARIDGRKRAPAG